jgi:hypothetical protein
MSDELKKRAADHIARNEKDGIDYDDQPTDRLLAIQAVNNWSGKALAEGADLKIIVGGDNPCCSTYEDLNHLMSLLHARPSILFPTSGFNLPEDPASEGLMFGFSNSAFRLRPHINGSRSQAIGIAEARPLEDAEEAFNLWLASATESCMGYLENRMASYDLGLEKAQEGEIREIVRAALRQEFSQAQVWNVIWRSVQNAAALTSRPYYNREKAAKTILNKIKKLLEQAHKGDLELAQYDRPGYLPKSAVLALFEERFGVDDEMHGRDVLATLDAEVAEQPDDEPDFPDMEAHGVFYFQGPLTAMDQLILKHFENTSIDELPEIEDFPGLVRYAFQMRSLYSFLSLDFVNDALPLIEQDENLEEHIKKIIAKGLPMWGQDSHRDAFDVFDLFMFLRTDMKISLAGCRTTWSGQQLNGSRLDFIGGQLSVYEHKLGMGHSDAELVVAAAAGELDTVYDLIGTGVSNCVYSHNKLEHAELLRRTAERLIDEATELERQVSAAQTKAAAPSETTDRPTT